MDDMSLVYNIHLCRVCQIPDKLDLVNTLTTTTDREESYLDQLKFIFNDIAWIEDHLISVACTLCLEKIKETAKFKRICLESNTRRAAFNVDCIKIEIETVKFESEHKNAITDDDDEGDCRTEISPLKINSGLAEKRISIANKPKFKKGSKNTTKAKGRVKKKIKAGVVKLSEDENNLEEYKGNVENCALRTDANEKDVEIEDIDSIEIDKKVSQYIPKYIPLPHERSCRDCKKKFTTMEKLRQHIGKTHLKFRRYHCDICQEGFKAKDAMERHAYKHNGLRNYVCTVCGSKYITQSDLYLHLLRHEDEPKFVCKLCPHKKYKTQSSLRSHIVLVHKDPKGFLCTECGTTFSQTGALKLHMLRRHGTRNFACASCDKTFCTKTDLKVHTARHANVKAYKCDLCSADYKDKRSLSKHKAKTHGIGQYKCKDPQKYECSYCSKIIASKDRLRRHIRTHTGIKPFKCRLCDQKFNCKSYIRGHLKGKHDIDVEASDYDTKYYYDVCEESILNEQYAGIPVNPLIKSTD